MQIDMTPVERRASAGLAAVFGLRMLGLFLILPVFALYAEGLPDGGNHMLVGLALGVYGLTQALLQLPFGMASDRFGRKRVIYIGLAVFAIGSVVAASATTLPGIILGRALQGAGAISAAVIALLADLTREEHRTRAMAMVGMTIGLSFVFSLAVGPLLYKWIDIPGMFLLTAVLAVAAIGVVAKLVPEPEVSEFHSDSEVSTGRLGSVLKDGRLLSLDFGIFALHAAHMAMFVVVPFLLVNAGLAEEHQWQVYLPVMLASFTIMIPLIIIGEKKARLKEVFLIGVGLLLLVELAFALSRPTLWHLALLLFVFFTAFNLLEASLPSWVSKVAPPSAKGTAMGVYNTSQSLGVFTGGLIGGLLSQNIGPHAVFEASAILVAVWLVVAWRMPRPPAVRTQMFHLAPVSAEQALDMQRRLATLAGVREAEVIAGEHMAVLKVDLSAWDEDGARKIMGDSNGC